jgi:3-oxoacyl-[acyl-carrier-protein] synthase-1
MEKVFVTGMGIISALGKGVDANLDALKNSRSGIGPIENLDTVHKDDYLAAEIKLSNEELSTFTPKLKNLNKSTRGQLLSIIAAEEALQMAGLKEDEIHRIPLIAGNTVASMDETEKNYRNYKSAEPYYFNEAHSGGETTRKTAEYFGIEAMNTTINTACSSSANAIIFGMRLIQSGRAQRVLVGGSDPFTKFSLNGFLSLKIYDSGLCRPFDAEREGLNLGEGAAFLVLESEDAAKSKTKYAEILGYANRNDAFHASASSPDGEGAYLTMKQAIEMSGLTPGQIDFVHTHGTATPNNDESELNALQRIFGTNIPPFASSKSYTGHTLGGAGSVNAVFSILSMQHSFLFANLNFKTPMEHGIRPVSEVRENVSINYVISNAFGFGGNNSSLVFGKGGHDE